ncbi:MAG: hypothetical protein Q9191_008375, partial [Dirinaria sp. TL-2023a]
MNKNTLVPKGFQRYEDAVNLLNSQRRQLRPQTGPGPNARMEAMPQNPTFKGTPSLYNMKHWLHCVGHSDTYIDGLNVIHVAGTKGKGSTCAFTQSFLQVHSKRAGFPKKTGLYTSPHLKTIRERIQIDSKPIQKHLFTKYFYEVWNSLTSEDLPRPRFLQLLMLVAVHAFISEKVEVAIFETHNGGEYDATNIFTKPIATGIATIGMDHVEQLGPSIENIAWHKAGIFKTGSPAYSVNQESQAAAVLKRRANERNVSLEFVRDELADNTDAPAMKTAVQRRNAALAVRLANAFLSQKGPN